MAKDLDDDDYSPLSQSFKQDGKAVEVKIYYCDGDRLGNKGWILEIEDKHFNSIVYDELFNTDQEALDQFLEDVKKEGIDSFIG